MQTRKTKVLDSYGRPIEVPVQPASTPRLRSRYDAAQTVANNSRHWAYTDALSAAEANSLHVRKRLRERSRYEYANNGYAQGLTLTLANDLFGEEGPILKVLTENEEVNRKVKEAWEDWAAAVGLMDLLPTMKQAKVRDGEGFLLLITNPDHDHPVQLDLQEIECDQVSSPWGESYPYGKRWVDGIELDERNRPVAYHVLKEHPGSMMQPWSGGVWGEYSRIPARQMIHWFRRDRPGQLRGVPELTASLPLFAQLRRYTLATLTAAETAACFAALLETEASPDADTVEPTPFENLEIVMNMMTTLPAGSKMKQFDPKQPVNTYEMFKREILKEIGRPVNAPYNVSAGDSSPYNFSSARMDRILYQTSIRVERGSCRRHVLERIFMAWLDEAVMVPGLLPAEVNISSLPHCWYWPGFESIEPLKDAKADTERLANGTTTLEELLAEYGQDWKQFIIQRGLEVKLMRENGLEPPARPGQTSAPAPAEEEEEEANRA